LDEVSMILIIIFINLIDLVHFIRNVILRNTRMCYIDSLVI